MVRVATSAGHDSATGFVYIPPPTPIHITRFTPTSARTGDTVQLFGHSFTGTTSISFNFIAAQRYTVINDTTIDAIVGNGASGLIRIAGSNGLDSIAGFTFIDSASIPDTTTHDTTVAVFQIAQFNGSVVANQAVLRWKAMHEKGLSYYVIEHGADTSHLSAIGAVPAMNEDSASYSFTDTTSRSGINYYRVQAEEATGDTVNSGITAVQLAGAPATLTGYPNPAVNSILVALPSILKQSKVMLVDMNGNTLQTIVVGANIPQTQIDVSHLNAGIYKLVWSDGTNVSYQLVMIMK